MKEIKKQFLFILACLPLAGLQAQTVKTESNPIKENSKTDTIMSEYKLKTGKIGENVQKGYKAVENGVVSGYQAVEDAVVSTYKKIENKFVDTFLEKVEDGKTEEATEKKEK